MNMRRSQNLLHRPNQGFSLVEIMVGMVIALISTVIVMQVFATFEGQKRTTTGGADAQTNGAIALFTIERDLKMAGYGFNSANALGCTVKRFYNGQVISDLTLAPVEITNGSDAPDSITIRASSKTGWSIPTTITDGLPPEANPFKVKSTIGMNESDLLIATDGSNCTLLQATSLKDNNNQASFTMIHHAGGNASPWNPTGNAALDIYPLSGYDTGAQLINLGSLTEHIYSLDNSRSLIFSDYQSANNNYTTLAIAPEIVDLQAQYGFSSAGNGQVDSWDISGDLKQVYAVRFAILARNGNKEKPLANGSCNITTAAPTWAGGSFAMAQIPNWQCYRYKVFETVVPLRNMIWKQ